jgi:hypothetical protein
MGVVGRLDQYASMLAGEFDDYSMSENLLLYSEDFSNAYWTKSNVSVTSNAITSPFGLSNASKLIESASTAVHELFRSDGALSVGTDTYISLSIFAKAAERQYCYIRSSGNSKRIAVVVDLSNGTFNVTNWGFTLNSSATVTPYPNGWYRITCTSQSNYPAAPGWNGIFIVSPLDTYQLASNVGGSGYSYAGNGTSGIYIWGAHYEFGPTATDYTPTTTTAKTRVLPATTNTNITGLGTYYSSGFYENVGVATFLPANIFAPYNPVYDEFGGTLFGAGQGRYMRQYIDKSVIVYNEIDEITDLFGRGIVRDGLVLDLDAGVRDSYPGSGTTWRDLSVYNENFTLYNSPTFSTNYGGELLFSGLNDYARITTSSSIDSSASNGTIEVWFRTISSTLGVTYARLVSFSDATGTGSDTTSTQGTNRDYDNYLCLVKNNTAESLGLWYKNNPNAFGPATLVNTNNYFNATITWSTSGSNMTFKFYLNGSNTNTSTIAQSGYSTNATTITLGQNCAGALTNPLENSSCAFSSFKLYNRALTASEIQQNYNALRNRFGL